METPPAGKRASNAEDWGFLVVEDVFEFVWAPDVWVPDCLPVGVNVFVFEVDFTVVEPVSLEGLESVLVAEEGVSSDIASWRVF